MNEREQEIRKRVEKARKGPWVMTEEGSDEIYFRNGYFDVAGIPVSLYRQADAVFIAHSREDVPYLLDELDRTEADNLRLKREILEADLEWKHDLRRLEEVLGELGRLRDLVAVDGSLLSEMSVLCDPPAELWNKRQEMYMALPEGGDSDD